MVYCVNRSPSELESVSMPSSVRSLERWRGACSLLVVGSDPAGAGPASGLNTIDASTRFADSGLVVEVGELTGSYSSVAWGVVESNERREMVSYLSCFRSRRG